jgi:hypothetical protein
MGQGNFPRLWVATAPHQGGARGGVVGTTKGAGIHQAALFLQ